VSRTRVHARWIAVAWIAALWPVAPAPAGQAPAKAPRNVILLVGDGMGPAQLEAASLYAHGAPGKLFMQTLGRMAEIETAPAGETTLVTDSAAASTAFATGRKVANRVVSVRVPGDGSAMPTVLEKFKADGKRTGLVTTAWITHATPAAFGAHVVRRDMYGQIARQYLAKTRPNVLFGGTEAKGKGMTPEAAAKAGYTVVADRREMQAINAAKVRFVSGQFGAGHMPYEYTDRTWEGVAYARLPHLSEMTAKALAILSAGPKGFFLMVEAGRIDHAGHAQHLQQNVFETLELDRTVRVVMAWAKRRTDTLVLVTADHETGGLVVVKSNGKGKFPDVRWATDGHTGVNVPLIAWGVGAERVRGVLDNTDIYRLMLGLAPLRSRRGASTRPTSRPAAPAAAAGP